MRAPLRWLRDYVEFAETPEIMADRLTMAGIPVEKIESLMDSIEGDIFDTADKEISSTRIGEIVMEHLKDLDAVAYVRFASVYREFKDVSTFMDELKKFMEP